MPASSSSHRFIRCISHCWRSLRFWHRLLRPARASFLAVVLFGVLFLKVDQGGDILRRLGSAGDLVSNNETIDWPRIATLYGALLLFGLASWAWARFLLRCRFPGVPKVGAAGKYRKVRRFTRRLLGLGPAGVLGAAFFRLWLRSPSSAELASQHSGRTPDSFYGWLAAGCVAVGILLYAYFELWRRWEARKRPGGGPPIPGGYRDLRNIFSEPTLLAALGGTALVSAAMFFAFTLRPVALGEAVGSGAIIMLAIACWLSVGSALVYFGSHYRVPVLALAGALAFGASYLNDNHDIRTLAERPPEPGSGTVDAALDRWFDHVNAKYPLAKGTPRPLFLVAAAGGGIRAGYWSAIVLGRLEDLSAEQRRASFAEHTFAISAVSGGALGAATFDALVAVGSTGQSFRDRAQWLLDDDFLAGDLAKMGFADLLQRFIPWRIPPWDRARSLEDAWAAAWDQTERPASGNPFDRSIGDLFALARQPRAGDPLGLWLPALLLNGTSADTGKRILTSNLTIDSRSWRRGVEDPGEFPDVLSAADKLGGQPMRVSTAVHQSARFTYFSPAGRFPDGTRIVDGGYFENSGATTLLDLLDTVRRSLAERTAHPRAGAPFEDRWADVRPALILIDNAPLALPSAGASRSPEADGAPRETAHGVERGPDHRRYLQELLTPLDALLQAWNAQSNLAVARAQDFARPASGPGLEHPLFEFHLYNRGVDLPLGWTLSGRAVAEMNQQLANPISKSIDYPAECRKIIELLPARGAQ